MPTVSQPVATATILNDFITMVKNPAMSTLSTWHAGAPPPGMASHASLGPQGQADPVWPGAAQVGPITTTNVFFILHGFAIAWTRHRLGRAYVRNNTPTPTDLGFALTSYIANSVVWFDYPTIPTPGDPVTAGTINTFLAALSAQVSAIRGNGGYAADFYGCHSSCHSSCHGSRGRR